MSPKAGAQACEARAVAFGLAAQFAALFAALQV